MGMLEQIAADVAEMKEMLAAMNAPAGSAEESKPKTTTKPKATKPKAEPKKDEKPKSDHTAEDVRNKFLALQSAKGDDVAKGVITDLGYKKLAELIADAENWDKAVEAAQAALDAEDAEEDDNGGL